jgi:pimeloyl-ACP methyl ester carboxylesterase
MKKLVWLAIPLMVASCKKHPADRGLYVESKIQIGSYSLSTYNIPKISAKYLVVFETGLGDFSKVWKDSKVPDSIQSNLDVVLYDRAGYNTSTTAPAPRDVDKMRSDLEQVMNRYANGRKVIFVAHSLGGYIVRDFAVKNPSKVAAILFVDPSHEIYNGLIDQPLEDLIYNSFKTKYGANFGGTMEARELIEDAAYMSVLPNLPNVPVMVITSMQINASQGQDAADRQLWYTAHEALKTGLSDFSHFTTTASGHYIMSTEPGLVISKLRALVAKLP